ncbi:MAG TPA: aquaporin [Acidimicrobiales bacterium]|nr:aquaporin [Acidimicrobiales bacterium]
MHLAEWGAELVGTMILVFGGLSAVVLDFHRGTPVARVIPSTSGRLLLTGALFAATGSLVVISPLGRRSGGHLNPAVTLAFWLTDHVHPHDLAGYCGAQLAGGLAGAALLRATWGAEAAQVHDGITLPGPHTGAGQAAVIEAVMTAALVWTIFACVSSPRTARWTPVAIWALVTVEVWRVAPFTGTSLNPARSLGPAVMSGDFHTFWVYVVGPLGGAAVAAGVWRLAPWRILTAKLFHDPRYPSTLRSALPVRAEVA